MTAPANLMNKVATELAAIDPHRDDFADLVIVPSLPDAIAARAAIRHAEHTAPPPNVDPATGEVLTLNIPTSLYDERPELAMIRQAAHSMARPVDAVLGAVLARCAAMTPPTIQGPAPVATPCSLNVFVALIGPSGAGKSTAFDAGERIIPDVLGAELVTRSVGSGEGAIEVFMGTDEIVDDDGKKRKVRAQVHRCALLMLDEGQALSEMASRKGSTLLPTLRSAWSGQRLGQANASDERTRYLPPHEYRLVLAAGFQLETAVALIDDAATGTPQRFLWLSATDPTIPDKAPPWPGAMQWSPPRRPAGPLDLAPEVAAEIRGRNIAVARGDLVLDQLDAHRDQGRLKVAALLAILAGREDINADDWRLAGIVLDTSDRVRGSIIAAARQRAAEADKAQTRKAISRNIAMASNEEHRALDAMTKAMARVIDKHAKAGECADGCTRRCLSRSTSSKHRVHVTIDEAIDDAVARGWVSVDGDRFRAGESRPS